ncbi:MAG: glycoside hydrolase family 3 C-terminal domain-containing protein [Ignavibacteriaceae bacterium]
MKTIKITTLTYSFLLFLLVIIFSGSKFQLKKEMPVYKNPKYSVNDRVEDLLKRLTLEEKISLLGGTGFATKPIERLGIPELKMNDGPLGVRWGNSSAYPAGIAMAATWDTSLINKLGVSIGQEVKGKGRDVILGPCVNIARIPQGGRNFESFGEDPFLASRMAVSYIEGVQSQDVAATVKHFAVNNQEYERMFVNVKIDHRALNEIYLRSFKAAVKEAKVLAIMAAYNKVNGTFCSENDYLLKTKLKKDWGFTGLAMSDWGAVHSSIPVANGGLDLEMPLGTFLNDSTLSDAIKDGIVKESTIDDKVRRIFRVMFELGLFDKQRSPDNNLINTKEHREVALKTAMEGIVLLKNNDNILPLDQNKIKSIAVIGPGANHARVGGGGSSMVDPIFSISPLEALQNKIGSKIKINFAEGVVLDGDGTSIDSSFFYLPNNPSKHGLVAEFFDNKDLDGKPVLTRIDKEINFNWGNVAPFSGFRNVNYSARWTTLIKPKKTGEYLIDVTSDDGARVFLDGKLIVDQWSDHASEVHSYKTKLVAGIYYNLKYEYYQSGGDAVAKLGWRPPNEDLIAKAISLAKKSDVVVVFAGTSQFFESEGFDRAKLNLPNGQDKLIEALAKVNKNVIVVLNSGSPVIMNNWINKVNCILEAWFGGEEVGNAIADVLLGNYNPSGKLPVTFPKSWKDCSAYKTYKAQDSVSNYSDGIFVGYRHFDKDNIQPLFPFGFGLSYTKFSYSDLTIKPASGDDGNYKVVFKVKNSGKILGTEIPQVYLGMLNSKVARPVKELKAFDRITLKPGEIKEVAFYVDRNALAYFNDKNESWITEPGKVRVMVGSSSRDIRLTGEFTIAKTKD